MLLSADMVGEISIGQLARSSAALTATEIGLGSVLHGLHIPFSGNFLSLNQGFLLSRAVWNHRNSRGCRVFPARVSGVSALLKSLSPAGKKLTPMLAIGAQGCLFSLATILLGPNLWGVTLGMTLLCLWPFVQPILIYYVLFGNPLLDALTSMLRNIQRHIPFTDRHLIYGFMAVVGLKLILGWCLVGLSRTSKLENLLPDLHRAGASRLGILLTIERSHLIHYTEAAHQTVKDLLNPLFLLSWVMTFIFFYFSDSPLSSTIWALMRPLALGFILLFFVRIFPNRYLPRTVRSTLDTLRANYGN